MQTVSGLGLRPLTAAIGAAIDGVDLSGPLDDELIDAIEDAVCAFGVVFFPGQSLDPAVHLAFARRLGEIKPPSPLLGTLEQDGHPEIGVITMGRGGTSSPPRADSWHTDTTYSDTPPRYTVLHMQIAPLVGGDTLWASTKASYDALSEPIKQLLEPLTATHVAHSRSDLSAVHPVVIRSPKDGRKALFTNPLFARRINELQEEESKAVLAMLAVHGIRPDFTCRWRWTEGDIAIWDNHFVWHYVTGDFLPEPRRIHRIEITGCKPVPATA
jgi:taurine dioxygenase